MRVYLLIPMVFATFVATQCKKTTDKKDKAPPRAPRVVTPKGPKLTLAPLWEKEMLGLSVAGDSPAETIYAITFQGRRNHLSARRQSTFEAVTGVMRWQKKRALSTFRYGVPWTTRFALRPDALYYVSKNSNIVPLSLKGGGAGKGLNSVSGFSLFDTSMVVADRRPYILDSASGQKTTIGGITEIKKGGTPRLRKDYPVRVHGTTAFIRTTDGALRALDLKTAREKWRYQDPKDSRRYTYDLPSSKEGVLVPVLYPDLAISTEVRFPTEEGESEVTLPGRISTRLDPLQHGSLVSWFISTGPKTHSLSTVDLKEGRLLYSMETPSTRCDVGGSTMACRKKKTLHVFAHSTGELLYKKSFDRTISFVSVAGERIAVELSDTSLVILSSADGNIIWKGKVVIKNAPTHLAALVHGQGDRIALLLRTDWESRPRLNRLYLRIFSTTMPDSHVDLKLGPPSEHRRDNRVTGALGQVSLKTPVWIEGNTIISAVDGVYMAVDVNRARQLRSFSLPGKGGSPASLVARRQGVALIERGNWLSAVNDHHKILWSRPMKGQEVADVSGTQAVIHLREGFEVIDLVTGKPVKTPFKPEAAMKFIAFYKGSWYLKRGKKMQIFEASSLKETDTLPSRYFHFHGLDVIAFTRRSTLKEKASWAQLSLASGQVQWRYTFSKHPSDLGTARSIAELCPRVPKGDAPWWAVGTPSGYLIPGAAHRCVHLVDPSRGQVTWVRCFHRLGGPPLVFPSGDILISAVGPFAEPGKPFTGEAPSGDGTLSLYFIDGKTWKVTSVYRHDRLSAGLPLKIPQRGGPLVVTLWGERKVVKKSILKAFSLQWRP